MATDQKTYAVRFYCGTAKNSDGETKAVSEILSRLAVAAENGDQNFQSHAGDERFELRDLYKSAAGGYISGVLAVLRPDAPHIREASGSEKPIPLKEGDSVIEKNHFIYYREHELLAWQVNGRGSHVSRMEKHLSMATGMNYLVTLDDVLTLDALTRLSQGIVTKLEFRAAKPKNAALIDSANWESAAFDMMSESDATLVNVSVSTRSRHSGLSSSLKGAIHRLLNAETTRKVQVKLRAVEDPIDLMAECLKGKITVKMKGLYPDSKQVIAEMDTVKRSLQASIDAYFGKGDAVLG